MNYHCPACGSLIASWVVNSERFECPECGVALLSNSRKTFRRSLVVALIAWLVFWIAMRQYMGSWGVAAAVSLEGGGILSAMVAAFYYHRTVKLIVQCE